MPNNLIAEIAKEFISGNTEIVDIVSFVEAPWGLNIKLFPVQRFSLKAFYGLPLDDTKQDIKVPDVINEKILYTFTEKSFLKFLYEEGRCNTDTTEGKIFQELVMPIGRRGGKCRAMEDRIATTEGSITFGDLLERKHRCANIGILTYDPETLKSKVTHDFEIWDNGDVGCFELETKRGLFEISSGNHPYLVWKDGEEKPSFVSLSELKKGDRVAISNNVGLFGRGGIGLGRAALLGYFQGDGGTTERPTMTIACPTKLADFTHLIQQEFPMCKVKPLGKTSFHYGYNVLKASGRFKQDGSQKNAVMEWLRGAGCIGKKSIDKEVPDCIFKASKEETAIFLSRLFACDGWATVAGRVQEGHKGVPKSSIGYASSSKKMIDGVRHLLLKFGVHSVVRFRKTKCKGKVFDSWGLDIVMRDSIEIFAKEIGIFAKEDAVSKVVNMARLRVESKSEFDSAPRGIWNRVRAAMTDGGLSCADVMGKHGVGNNERLHMQYSPSRRKVLQYGINTGDKFLMDMATSDVRWDKVESVSPVGLRKTVDLCVSGTHIIGGDILSHNSSEASFISNYELYKLLKRGDPSKYYGFPANTPIYIMNVAPADDQAGGLFDMIHNMARQCPFIKERCLHSTMTYFDLQSDADLKLYGKPKANITLMAGGCASNSLRGRNAIVVIMDEMAHFIDNNGRFSGSEVYKALTPSIASFRRDGKVVCISSPYAKYGAFYERFQQSFQEKDFTLMFKMYSAMMNPTIPTEILAAARRRDRVGFMCEYGGEFSDTITAWIDDETEFRKCVTQEPIKLRGIYDVSYYMGIDLGFKNDGTAIGIVHKNKQNQRIVVDYANVWFSASSDVWEFENGLYTGCRKYATRELLSIAEIVEEIKELCQWFGIKAGIFDQHNGYALAEILKSQRLKQFEMEQFTDTLNSDVYQLAKTLYSEKLLEFPNHPVLIPELLTLEAEKKAKNKIDVRAPNRRGAHDDICEAVIRAVWLCHKNQSERPYAVATGAGGSMGVSARMFTPDGMPRQETAATYRLNKLKKHGEHPRGLDGFRRRTQSGVSIPGMLARRLTTGI
jgi:intein/homing endonuclease